MEIWLSFLILPITNPNSPNFFLWLFYSSLQRTFNAPCFVSTHIFSIRTAWSSCEFWTTRVGTIRKSVACQWDMFLYLGCLVWPQWERMHLAPQTLDVPEWGIQRQGTNLSEEKGGWGSILLRSEQDAKWINILFIHYICIYNDQWTRSY